LLLSLMLNRTYLKVPCEPRYCANTAVATVRNFEIGSL
jgi:hypothetical protein